MSETQKTSNPTIERAKHSGEADKARGRADQVVGTVKEKVGGAIGDDRLEARGRMQKTDGKVEEVKGGIKKTIENAGAKVKGSVEAIKETAAEKRQR
jgi:uncharacterized protein YjbJ (UPF0337 family)